MKTTVPVTVHIMDKEYRVACPPEERDALLRAAAMVDDRMRVVRDSGRLVGLDRIAVVTALNLANELLAQQNNAPATSAPSTDFVSSRLRNLNDKVEGALRSGAQLEL